MKRLNPNTGLPFKRGDVREDGRIFCQYNTKKLLDTGFFVEHWRSKYGFFKSVKDDVIAKRRRHAAPRGRSLHLVNTAKKRALAKNIKFDINQKDIERILEIGVCQLTGIKFSFDRPKNTHHNPFSPSIDRIDSKKGYTKENVRVVLTAVNTSLGQYGDTIMLPILEAMVKGIKKNAKKAKLTPVSN